MDDCRSRNARSRTWMMATNGMAKFAVREAWWRLAMMPGKSIDFDLSFFKPFKSCAKVKMTF